jgi:hypothetical protein
MDPLTTLVSGVVGHDVHRAAEILEDLGGLSGLTHASEAELTRLGVKRPSARLLAAAFELGR